MQHLIRFFIHRLTNILSGGYQRLIEQLGKRGILIPAFTSDRLSAAAEEIAGEVIRIAIVAAPAKEVKSSQPAFSAGAEVGWPVAFQVELNVDPGFRQISGSRFSNFFPRWEVEACNRQVVKPQRHLVASFEHNRAARIQ